MARRDYGRDGRIFPRFSVREDVEREIQSHAALLAEDLVAAGWSEADAAKEAERLMGDRAQVARACVDIVRRHHRAERRARIVDTLMQDLRYGVRTVFRSPGFAVVAVLTLALGIGANTAIFSVVRGVLLEPLPYDQPDELVVVRETRQDGGTMPVAWANFVDWKAQSTTFDALFAYGVRPTTLLGGDDPVTAQVATVTRDVWPAFGVVPVEGRLTTPDDHLFEAEPTVVVSRSFWQNQLGGRALSQLLVDVNGLRARVVGVVPDELDFPAGAEVWQPLELFEQSESRSAHNVRVVGRLGDGVPIERAAEEMDQLTKRVVQPEAGVDLDFFAAGAYVGALRADLVGDTRLPLLMLLGAAGLVLVVACTNLGSTLLARGAHRERELAVRSSMGAGQGRIVRQLVTESAVLAVAGATAGVVLAALLIGLLQRLGPDSLPRLQYVAIDGPVLLFTAGITAITVLLFGLLPALGVTLRDAAAVLRSGDRGSSEGTKAVVWKVLVGTEVALALVLLVGSGLLVRSFRTLLAQDTGVDASDVLVTPSALSNLKYETPEAHASWYARTLLELGRLAGVSAAGVTTALPVADAMPTGQLELDGDLEKHVVAGYIVASAGAFEALDIPLSQGRLFDDRDTPDVGHVAIVSESFAREVWPGENPIGRLVTGGGMDDFWQDRRFAEVVGVVGDVRYGQLGAPPTPTVYFPYLQRPFRIRFGASLVVEAANGDPASIGQAFRSTVQRMDPDVPMELATQESLIGESLAARQFTMLLLGGFSIVALVLAVVGIYGVISYTVARRTREMGIRMALGADPGDVLRMVMSSSMRMVSGGLVLGLVASVAGGRVISGLLYSVSPTDPVALLGGVALLAAAAAVASWLPARRGTRVDPMVTMRGE